MKIHCGTFFLKQDKISGIKFFEIHFKTSFLEQDFQNKLSMTFIILSKMCFLKCISKTSFLGRDFSCNILILFFYYSRDGAAAKAELLKVVGCSEREANRTIWLFYQLWGAGSNCPQLFAT